MWAKFADNAAHKAYANCALSCAGKMGNLGNCIPFVPRTVPTLPGVRTERASEWIEYDSRFRVGGNDPTKQPGQHIVPRIARLEATIAHGKGSLLPPVDPRNGQYQFCQSLLKCQEGEKRHAREPLPVWERG